MIEWLDKVGRGFIRGVDGFFGLIGKFFMLPFAVLAFLAAYRTRRDFSPGSIVRAKSGVNCHAVGQDEFMTINDPYWGPTTERNPAYGRFLDEGSTIMIVNSSFRSMFDHKERGYATFEFLLSGVLCRYQGSCRDLLKFFEVIRDEQH